MPVPEPLSPREKAEAHPKPRTQGSIGIGAGTDRAPREGIADQMELWVREGSLKVILSWVTAHQESLLSPARSLSV